VRWTNRQSTFLGLKQLPRELTAFEIEAFFTFTLAQRQLIEDRRRPTLKLGLALQIGFLRMSGRLLDAVPIVPPALWRHLGSQFAIAAPDLASLRALYRRAPTLIAHQQLACEALGFRWLSEPQRRALVRALRQDLTRTRDRQRLLVFARRWLYDHQLIIMHERALRSVIVSAKQGVKELPVSTSIDFGKVWKALLSGADREQAFRAFEVATLLALRRALRNGTVWIDHSLAFRSRERLFIPTETWQKERNSYYRRLSLPKRAESYLEPLIERAQAGVAAVTKAVEAGELRVDDELHLTPLAAEEEEPELVKLRAALDHRIGEAQLPELLLEVDANLRFSWIMLGREPRSDKELLMVYAGILAHGTSMSAAETARMMPQLSAPSVRQAMRWAGDERRLAEASAAVLGYLRRHPISATWGRSDLASSDMMSLETRQRVWQARLDPRRQTPSVGIYSHVLAGWGIFHAQPIVLNERQVGAAIEGVLRQETIDIVQLAVDTHRYTDFGMAFAHGPGLDLCPRLKALKDRHLFLPRGYEVPQILQPICEASLDLSEVPMHWDRWVHLIASAYSGHASAINVLARFGSAARGDPLYEVGVVIGRLLRTVFLADYFVNPVFRRELLRVLNRGEATNALKRLIYTGRVANYQAKSEDEMQAVADALSLLANIVMAWNTAKMQAIFRPLSAAS
jgi:TnpA family transposase